MNRSVFLLGLLVLTVSLLGCEPEEDEMPAASGEVVRALRYRIIWADSALDLSHGGGRWVQELFFPETKLTATLVFESQTTSEDPLEFTMLPRIYVGRSDKPRTDLTGLSDDPPEPAKEVQVSAQLAKAIAAFADLDARARAESARLGLELRTALGLDPTPETAEPGGAPRDEAVEPSEE